MEARINLKVQGIRGGNPMWSENKGNVTVFVNHSYQKAYNDFISVDAFQGYGNDYERRKECLVEIQSEGKTVFLGTFEELKEKLLK